MPRWPKLASAVLGVDVMYWCVRTHVGVARGMLELICECRTMLAYGRTNRTRGTACSELGVVPSVKLGVHWTEQGHEGIKL